MLDGEEYEIEPSPEGCGKLLIIAFIGCLIMTTLIIICK
jgi:hypothetical protein